MWLAPRPAPLPRGLPHGVTVFANARINKTTSYPCIAPRVQKHAPPRLGTNATYRRTLCAIVQKCIPMVDFEIIIGKGLNNIPFGCCQEDIISQIGEPDKIEELDYPDNTTSKTLEYYDLNISFSLSSEDNYRLTDIEFLNEKFHIKNQIHVGLSKKRALEVAKKCELGDYIIEDCRTIECPTHELINFKTTGVFLWIDKNKISSIQIGPLWQDENTIKWPE